MSITINSITNEKYLYPYKKPKIKGFEKLNINTLLNISQIKNLILEQKIFNNKVGTSIKNISGYFCKRDFINEEIIKKINNTSFKKDYENLLKNTYNAKKVEDVIKYLYVEYFILTDLFNLKLIKKEELLNYLIFSQKKEKFLKNSNLLVTNKQAFELTKNTIDLFLSGKRYKLKEEVVFLFNELNIRLLEIPQFYKLELLIEFLKEIKQIKNNLKIENFNFNLRFKKLKHFKKDGMYIVNDKTIIVDPRKPKAFLHELGHYIYEENIKYKKSKIKLKIINNKIEKSKFEDYSVESENFAYAFEKSLMN